MGPRGGAWRGIQVRLRAGDVTGDEAGVRTLLAMGTDRPLQDGVNPPAA